MAFSMCSHSITQFFFRARTSFDLCPLHRRQTKKSVQFIFQTDRYFATVAHARKYIRAPVRIPRRLHIRKGHRNHLAGEVTLQSCDMMKFHSPRPILFKCPCEMRLRSAFPVPTLSPTTERISFSVIPSWDSQTKSLILVATLNNRNSSPISVTKPCI